MTKLDILGKIWAKWNNHELDSDRAMIEIELLFPRAINKQWKIDCKRREEELKSKST